MTLSLRTALPLLLLAVAATPASADTPGGGGTKVPVPVTGEQVYRTVCQSCHMADARGATGAATIPALANNPKLEVDAYPILMIQRGSGAMPWFSDLLSPAQIAAVVGYIRTHFGNDFRKPVTEADVPKVEAPVAGH